MATDSKRPSRVDSAEAGSRVRSSHDRLSGERHAEIAARQLSEIIDELQRQAAVEAELMADLLDRLFGRAPVRQKGRRVTRKGTSQQEGDDDDADDARQRGREAAQGSSPSSQWISSI